ncbi:hypothetical protein TcWFU_007184 [Taenia crassiceps]|uniref:Uncharacterized protein n=1 Tax=Taenia crassiceps TaxID=6207 RepID=A0ABR4QLU5_9CEST
MAIADGPQLTLTEVEVYKPSSSSFSSFSSSTSSSSSSVSSAFSICWVEALNVRILLEKYTATNWWNKPAWSTNAAQVAEMSIAYTNASEMNQIGEPTN